MMHSPALWRFILFGCLGIVGEVFFTAILSIFQTRRLRLQGFSFLWMFPIYGLLAFLFPPIAHAIASYPLIIRGIIYMMGIFLVEYITGTILTALTGGHIWQYNDKFNVKGQITFLYSPVWFVVGLLVEKYYFVVDRLSRVMPTIIH